MRGDMSAEKPQPLFSSEPDPRGGEKLSGPDLNPLTNPTLGRNLGKWAQVYFTSPPEKRSHAVSELLRELESPLTSDDRWNGSFKAYPDNGADTVSGENETRNSPAATSTFACPECGRTTPPDQWFCGLCGFPLKGTPPGFGPSRGPLQSGTSSQPRAPQVSTSRMSEAQQSDLEWLRERRLSSFGNYNKRSHPFRTLLALALVIGLSGFLYFRWKDLAEVPSSPTPATDASRSATAQPATPKAAEGPRESGVTSSKTGVASNPAIGNSAQRTESQEPQTPALVESPKAPRPTDRTIQEAGMPSSDSGDHELAMAETILESGHKARETNQAAKWLWKSVAKHNVTALVMLADLYQRGDGVSKSCDQAQLLLVAAAKRGSVEAGQRLKHLQASGCK